MTILWIVPLVDVAVADRYMALARRMGFGVVVMAVRTGTALVTLTTARLVAVPLLPVTVNSISRGPMLEYVFVWLRTPGVQAVGPDVVPSPQSHEHWSPELSPAPIVDEYVTDCPRSTGSANAISEALGRCAPIAISADVDADPDAVVTVRVTVYGNPSPPGG